ncbi:MAG: PGPGW domain-containing protein [Myxococcota bacterium]
MSDRPRLSASYRMARRLLVGFAGALVLLAGLVLLVLPGPGLLVIPAGLAILAAEFQWAQQLLRGVRERSGQWLRSVRRGAMQPGPGSG